MDATTIIAGIQAFGTLVVGVFLIYQNRILRTQVESQGQLITNMKSFQDIFDLKTLEEYVQIQEKRVVGKTEIEKREFEEKFKKELEAMKKTHEESVQINLELTKVFFSVITTHLDKDQRRKIISEKFPTQSENYINLLEQYEKEFNIADEVNDLLMLDQWRFNILRNSFAHNHFSKSYKNSIDSIILYIKNRQGSDPSKEV